MAESIELLRWSALGGPISSPSPERGSRSRFSSCETRCKTGRRTEPMRARVRTSRNRTVAVSTMWWTAGSRTPDLRRAKASVRLPAVVIERYREPSRARHIGPSATEWHQVVRRGMEFVCGTFARAGCGTESVTSRAAPASPQAASVAAVEHAPAPNEQGSRP